MSCVFAIYLSSIVWHTNLLMICCLVILKSDTSGGEALTDCGEPCVSKVGGGCSFPALSRRTLQSAAWTPALSGPFCTTSSAVPALLEAGRRGRSMELPLHPLSTRLLLSLGMLELRAGMSGEPKPLRVVFFRSCTYLPFAINSMNPWCL